MSRPSRPAPPKPTPKPGTVKVCRAKYPYTAQYRDELSFEEGDLLYVSDMETSKDWYKARCGQKSGLIPSNYIEESAETIDNPLHEAAKRGNIQFLQECLSNKISVNGLDKSGSTALYWASHGGHKECVSTLLSQLRVAVDAKNKLGDTALHGAAWKGHAEIVQLLLDKGARKDLKNNENKVPFDLARRPEVAKLLMTPITRLDDDDYIDEDGDDD